MNDKYFLDTNILIYSFDRHTSRKTRRSQEVLEHALETHQGILSTQVIQEFLNVATTKFSKPLTSSDAYQFLDTVLLPLCAVYPSAELYRLALELQSDTQYSFYDCLIIAAALQANCTTLYSEDLHHGHNIRGMIIRNPFLPATSRNS